MGLFDLFKNDYGHEMTPHKALACSMLYIMASDGEIDPEEVGQLLSIIGGENKNGIIIVGASNPHLLKESLNYIRHHTYSEFLQEVNEANLLSREQKFFILLNMVDSALSDGDAGKEEKKMLEKFRESFDISEGEFNPFYQTIQTKNNRKIFNSN